MTDLGLRALVRAWRDAPTPATEAAVVSAGLRAGRLALAQAELLAWVGGRGAREALGLAPDAPDEGLRLPSALFRPGAPVALASLTGSAELLAVARTADDRLALVLTVRGALLNRGQAAWLALVDELIALGPSRLLLEAEGVSRMGSSALTVLVRAADRAREEGWRVDLLGVPDRLWTVVEMLGLGLFLGRFTTVAGALAAPIPPARRAASTPSWLLGLSRWGPAACARAALAMAAAPSKDEPPDRRAAWRALAADVQARGAWDVRRLDERADWAPLDRACVHAALADWVLGQL